MGRIDEPDWQARARARSSEVSYETEQVEDKKPFWKKLLRTRNYVIAGGALLGAIAAVDSVYTVASDSVGLKTRFGAYTTTTASGIHLKLPFIEAVEEVPTTRVRTEEFGFRTISPGMKTEYLNSDKVASVNEDIKEAVIKEGERFGEVGEGDLDQKVVSLLLRESTVLTGDLKIVEWEYAVQWDVVDPFKFAYNVQDPRKLVRVASQTAMRRLVGDRSLDDNLTTGKEAIQADGQQEIQQILDGYNSGIRILTVKLQSGNPTPAVVPAYNEVVEARSKKEQLINESQQAYNDAIPKARGEAEGKIAQAQGEALEIINTAKGDVQQFNKALEMYLKFPEITRTRMIYDAFQGMIERSAEQVIIDPNVNGLLQYLNVSGGK